MSAIKTRALICAAVLFGIFLTIIAASETRKQRDPVAWCDIKSMTCYDQLGSAR